MEYTAVLVAAHLPGREPINLGVLLLAKGPTAFIFASAQTLMESNPSTRR
jgi:hypothetical protein